MHRFCISFPVSTRLFIVYYSLFMFIPISIYIFHHFPNHDFTHPPCRQVISPGYSAAIPDEALSSDDERPSAGLEFEVHQNL